MLKTIISRKKIFTIIISLILISILFIGGCGKKGQEDVIKIGAILPLTGNLSYLGQPEKNTLTFAIDKINSEGGINGNKVIAQYGDSKARPKEGVTLANKFISTEKVDVLITSLSNVSLAVQPNIDGNLVHLAICMHPQIAKNNRYTIRFYDNIWQEAEKIGELTQKLAKERIAILYIETPEVRTQVEDYLVPAFTKDEKKVVYSESYGFDVSNFNSFATKIKSRNPDEIIILGFGQKYPNIFRSLNQYNLLKEDIKVIGGLGFLSPGNTNKKLLEDVIFVAPKFSIEQNYNSKFVKQYEERYNNKPNYESAYIYDGIMIIKKGMEKANSSNPDKVITQILKLKQYKGVSGIIDITKSGDAETSLGYGIYKEGKIKPFE